MRFNIFFGHTAHTCQHKQCRIFTFFLVKSNKALSAGAEVESVHLYDITFAGCKSCFACKLKNSKTNGVCAIRDELRPILEKAYTADVIVIGSPIYFSHPTGLTHAFMERLMFPILTYNPKVDEQTGNTS